MLSPQALKLLKIYLKIHKIFGGIFYLTKEQKIGVSSKIHFQISKYLILCIIGSVQVFNVLKFWKQGDFAKVHVVVPYISATAIHLITLGIFVFCRHSYEKYVNSFLLFSKKFKGKVFYTELTYCYLFLVFLSRPRVYGTVVSVHLSITITLEEVY